MRSRSSNGRLKHRPAVDRVRVGVARVGVGHRPAARDEGVRLHLDAVAEAAPQRVVLAHERLEARDDAEAGRHGAGGVAERAEELERVLARDAGDGGVVAPLAHHVGAAVAADVERRRVLEPRAAVVGPDRQEPEVGDLLEQRPDHLGVVIADERVGQRHRVARPERPERMVHARAAQHRVPGEELLGHRPRLEAEQARDEAVRARQRGVPLEEREVGRQVVGRIQAAVERRVDELIERRAVGVEHRVDLALGSRLEPHGVGEAVHLDVGVARFGEPPHVGVGIEAALDARLLRQEDVVAGAVPAERRLQLERAPCRQRLIGQDVEHVGGGAEQAGRGRRLQPAGAVRAEFEPNRRACG